MDFAQIFETWKAMMAAGEDLPWWQDFYVKFYQAFIEAGRWQEYLQGVGVTLVATALALLMGVILGVAVSMVRTAHDQQRPGRRKNPALGVVNAVFPQAIKAILPALGNEFIILLKDTSLLSVIGGQELIYFAQAIANRNYEQMFPLVGAACMYLVLVMIFTWLLGKLERRLRQSDRR